MTKQVLQLNGLIFQFSHDTSFFSMTSIQVFSICYLWFDLRLSNWCKISMHSFTVWKTLEPSLVYNRVLCQSKLCICSFDSIISPHENYKDQLMTFFWGIMNHRSIKLSFASRNLTIIKQMHCPYETEFWGIEAHSTDILSNTNVEAAVKRFAHVFEV